MLLPALQTTAPAAGDTTIDALTLVLVVIFITSMVALSVVLRRGIEPADAEPEMPPHPSEPSLSQPAIAPVAPRVERLPPTSPSPVPAWLDGVSFASADASLTEAAQVIEALLSARRAHDLQRGLALYSPEMLRLLHESLGVDEAGLSEAMGSAEFAGDPPALRSIELVTASGNRMTVRAGYANGSAEVYRLARMDGRWSIEEITPGR